MKYHTVVIQICTTSNCLPAARVQLNAWRRCCFVCVWSLCECEYVACFAWHPFFSAYMFALLIEPSLFIYSFNRKCTILTATTSTHLLHPPFPAEMYAFVSNYCLFSWFNCICVYGWKNKNATGFCVYICGKYINLCWRIIKKKMSVAFGHSGLSAD